MRIRVVASCAAITCAGTALAGAASCVSSNNPNGPSGSDASFSEDSAPPLVDSGSDVTQPIADAGTDATPVGQDASDAALPCAPQNITGFVVPRYIPPHVPNVVACNNGESLALGAACYSDALTPEACAGFAEAGDDTEVPFRRRVSTVSSARRGATPASTARSFNRWSLSPTSPGASRRTTRPTPAWSVRSPFRPRGSARSTHASRAAP